MIQDSQRWHPRYEPWGSFRQEGGGAGDRKGVTALKDWLFGQK